MKRRCQMAVVAVGAGLFAAVGLAAAQDRPQGDVALPAEVVAAASAFDTFMDHAGALTGRFGDGEGVHRGLKTGAGYEMNQFEEGMIGYGAIIAVRDQAFEEGVQRAARDFGGPRALAQSLLDDPAVVMRIEGGEDAARQVAAALQRRATRVSVAGRLVKQAAYDVQHQAWSKVTVSNPAGRLAEAKTLSRTRFVASDQDNARVMRAERDSPPADGSAGPPFSPVVMRALALAAEAMLGEATEQDVPRLQTLYTERWGADCLNMAKLNLYQCLAVAGPQYEDLFCLGQHALIDTGQCVAKAAGAAPASGVSLVATNAGRREADAP
ncbi:MAG TPA: hypothetical protein VII73_03795 [Caulobacteraceae bacterium]